jgi:hypothetical protein
MIATTQSAHTLTQKMQIACLRKSMTVSMNHHYNPLKFPKIGALLFNSSLDTSGANQGLSALLAHCLGNTLNPSNRRQTHSSWKILGAKFDFASVGIALAACSKTKEFWTGG